MKPAAIGIRAHSGWAALITISGNPVRIDVVDRRRIELIDPKTPGAKQPYHFVQGWNLPDAEQYLAGCAAVSEQLAIAGLRNLAAELRSRDCNPVGCAILLASGRPLPRLSQILVSHSLIHSAEGEFFRQAFRKASERLNIPVTGIRERELDGRAEAILGGRVLQLKREIAKCGKSLGPPWTSDQKLAALAAMLVLASGDRPNLI